MSDALWVFGYGSLLWRPGFEVAERRLARLHGWHRSFCMSSVHYRGTQTDPGLVLALDAADNACCDGVALRAVPGQEAAVLAYLRERELISSAYLEARLPIRFHGADAGEAEAEALTYVINRDHFQYTGALSLEDQAQIIAYAHGDQGPNADYLYNTAAHLSELDLADADMDWLVVRVRELTNAA
ncbi:gamma-glutamylcyclotransferase [Rhodophyticola sp. CCM32]|uniref:gamma-glutamylcyclotransferase n=1 Tax=Rhodophyticola sp. CCM32 TaxID=2916397 RepID=UPI00107F7FEA|nr:gamma-glutamylcyclotransferase [Rhodophyticola sp. CCM32]QBY01017.1 gamma-glutamylcyclotransferase [Rhodophyticola sp. CCM32]